MHRALITECASIDSDPIPEFSKLLIASVIEKELSVPKQVECKRTHATVKVLSYLRGHEMINILGKGRNGSS